MFIKLCLGKIMYTDTQAHKESRQQHLAKSFRTINPFYIWWDIGRELQMSIRSLPCPCSSYAAPKAHFLQIRKTAKPHPAAIRMRGRQLKVTRCPDLCQTVTCLCVYVYASAYSMCVLARVRVATIQSTAEVAPAPKYGR